MIYWWVPSSLICIILYEKRNIIYEEPYVYPRRRLHREPAHDDDDRAQVLRISHGLRRNLAAFIYRYTSNEIHVYCTVSLTLLWWVYYTRIYKRIILLSCTLYTIYLNDVSLTTVFQSNIIINYKNYIICVEPPRRRVWRPKCIENRGIT